MIGEISVKETAKSQHIPLERFQCFQGSKSSLEITDIPDLVGTWKITGVSVSVHYPDGRTDVVEAKKTQGKYVATVSECQTPGIVKNGFSILAQAIDEQGQQVQTFVLGVGDVNVLSHDESTDPQKTYWSLKLLDSIPEHADKGDVVNVDGKMMYFDGESWTWNNTLSDYTRIPDAKIDGLVWTYCIDSGVETISAEISNLSSDNVEVKEEKYITEKEFDERLSVVEDKIPTKTSDLVNDSGYVTNTALTSYALKSDVDTIKSKIPAQASSSNQLADKNFVNSSITTATAYFRGTFNSTSQLPTSGITVNDYAFVIRTDTVGQTFYDRYKWNGQTWLFEYSINNSGFTAAQYAAINSGITSQKVSELMLSSDYNTVNLSGEYDDGTTFSYNMVVRI